MNATGQDDLPLDLLGILGTGERVKGLATTGTLSLVFGKIVNHILRGEVLATFSAIALGTRLLASFASGLFAGLGLIRRVGVVIKSRKRIVCAGVGPWTLLGSSAENPPLKPSDSRQGFLELASQLSDLGLLAANDLLELLSLLLPSRLPFGRTGMLCPPVLGLPAEFDLQTTDSTS